MKRTAGGTGCGTPKNVRLPTRPAAAVSRTSGHRTAPDGPMRAARAHFLGGRRQSCPPTFGGSLSQAATRIVLEFAPTGNDHDPGWPVCRSGSLSAAGWLLGVVHALAEEPQH
jgi:hypothetical protein